MLANCRIFRKGENMKNTKRLLTWILVVVLALSLTVCLTACIDKPETIELNKLELPKMEKNQMVVIIKNGENDYTDIVVTLNKDVTNGDELINYLVDTKTFSVEWEDSQYGKFLVAIGKIKADSSKNEYISIYTSVTADNGEATDPVYTVDGVKLYYSAKGISQMTVEDGAVIFFEKGSY